MEHFSLTSFLLYTVWRLISYHYMVCALKSLGMVFPQHFNKFALIKISTQTKACSYDGVILRRIILPATHLWVKRKKKDSSFSRTHSQQWLDHTTAHISTANTTTGKASYDFFIYETTAYMKWSSTLSLSIIQLFHMDIFYLFWVRKSQTVQ